jgi:hypothetical protein
LPPSRALGSQGTRHCDGDASGTSAKVNDAQRFRAFIPAVAKNSDRLLNEQLRAWARNESRRPDLEFAPVECPPTNEVLHWLMPTRALHQLTEHRKFLCRRLTIRVEIELKALAAEHMRDQEIRAQLR